MSRRVSGVVMVVVVVVVAMAGVGLHTASAVSPGSVLGWGYNTELLAKKKLPEPKCWKDLANPVYKDEIQMANPGTSGTAFNTVSTILQLMGGVEPNLVFATFAALALTALSLGSLGLFCGVFVRTDVSYCR